MKLSIYFLSPILLSYFIFCFIKADLNPFNWSVDLRVGMVVLCGILSIISRAYYEFTQANK